MITFCLNYSKIFRRQFSNAYGLAIKRNSAPSVDFNTHYPTKMSNSYSLATSSYTLADLQRHTANSPKIFCYHGSCVKNLSLRKILHGGRNNTGRITTRHRGGERARRIRLIDFKRGRKNIWATVLRVEYDPNRTAFISLIQYDDGVLSYVLATHCVGPGSRIIASETAPIQPGNCLPLHRIPIKTVVHSLESIAGCGGKFIRSSGTYAIVETVNQSYATVKLQSGEVRKFLVDCWATIGQVSHGKGIRKYVKAGERRWRGWRPHVRGCAMHKHKHPHGCERNGSSTKSRPPRNKWGKPAMNYKTRSPRKPMDLIVERRFKISLKNRTAFIEEARKKSKVR